MNTDSNHGNVDKPKLLALIPIEHRLPGVLFFVVEAVFVGIALSADRWVKISAIVGMALVACVFLIRFFSPGREKSESNLRVSNAEGSIGTELGDYREAVNKVKDLIDRSRKQLSFKFLAISGRSIMTYFLADLIKNYEGNLDIELQVVDPTSPHLDVMPKLWASEPETTVQEIIELWNARKYQGTLKVWKYKYLPCIGGEIINEEHLLITFFGWDDKTKKLGDFQEHYVYHTRDSKIGKKAFELYESWFKHAPKQNMFASEIDPAAAV